MGFHVFHKLVEPFLVVLIDEFAGIVEHVVDT